jgi:hypothetical protein
MFFCPVKSCLKDFPFDLHLLCVYDPILGAMVGTGKTDAVSVPRRVETRASAAPTTTQEPAASASAANSCSSSFTSIETPPSPVSALAAANAPSATGEIQSNRALIGLARVSEHDSIVLCLQPFSDNVPKIAGGSDHSVVLRLPRETPVHALAVWVGERLKVGANHVSIFDSLFF